MHNPEKNQQKQSKTVRIESMISIVLITYNRLKLLKLNVEQVLSKTSALTKEIIIWNNSSTDGTEQYLESIKHDQRLNIIHHKENIGVNARSRAFALATGEYLISLDDDVIDAPHNWDKTMLEAFQKIPKIGYLSANIIDDGKGTHANHMYRQRNLDSLEVTKIDGIEIIYGLAGNWCSITSRKAFDQVGGFEENPKFIYWHEDNLYVRKLIKSGYERGILKQLKVFHAAGPYYANDKNIQAAKRKFYLHLHRKRKWNNRKIQVKKILGKISGFPIFK
jgi:GT2 family glycosyltransferase